MSKKSIDISKNFCPHPMTLFLYGTYQEDNTPNFGLFCWLNFCWDKELRVMACIDGEKLTKDRIHANGVFSANMVTESMLPLADYLGHKNGYDTNEIPFDIETISGSVLQVPIFKNSPWSYELEVTKTIPLGGSEIYVCKICNVMADEELIAKDHSIQLQQTAPVVTTMETYFSLTRQGAWGDWKEKTAR
jgi:flavin reductase (DIM6/NTAB) family NADH-FMN oxidoreductase RutF